MRQVYKLMTGEEWADFKANGTFSGSPADKADGFIHFSYSHQVAETARRHFAGRGEVVLLAFSADSFGPALRDEISRGGQAFPHLYADLRLADVLRSETLPPGPDGQPLVPDHLED